MDHVTACRLVHMMVHLGTLSDQPIIMEARFNPRVLLHKLDVEPTLVVKEGGTDGGRHCADPHDPKRQHLKEEQEEVFISLGGEQLSGKEEVDAIRFLVNATPMKSEDDKPSPLLFQHHQGQIKGGELPEGNDGGAPVRLQDHGDGSISFKPEDTEEEEEEEQEEEEEDDDVKYPLSKQKHLSDSGLKTEDMDDDWKEGSPPDADGNIVQLFSSSETAEQLVDRHSVQKHTTDSDIISPFSLDSKTCLIARKNVNSRRKVQKEIKFSCEDCGKKFMTKETLKRHKQIHTGQKSFSCDLCGQTFSQKGYFDVHMRIHTGQKPFSCDLCGQRFCQKGHLKTHMGIHTGQKPFCCDLCGQRFRQKGNFDIHMRIHTGQKPFICNLCGHRFCGKSHLNRHMSFHTGQKPFCCDLCGQNFTQKGDLKIHMRIHTGQKPFSCDLCGQSFTRKATLTRHMKIHAGQ